MTAKYILEEIRARISMMQILERYTPRNVKHNRCACPLHDGRDNNFSVYHNSFYCWVCQKGGDTIKFVSEYLDIAYMAAARTIDADFALGLFEKPTLSQYRKMQKNERIRKQQQAELEVKKKYHKIQNDIFSEYTRNHDNSFAEYLWDLLDAFDGKKKFIDFDAKKYIKLATGGDIFDIKRHFQLDRV